MKTTSIQLMLALILAHVSLAHDGKTNKLPTQHERVGTVINADRQLSGRVIDEKGGGLPGVSIQIKNTTRGTTTDADGNYRLTIPDGAGTVLVFSFIGYTTQEINVGTQSIINVTLATDDKTLNEVVVVGYGTQRKRDITGAVATVNEATLKEVPAPNLVNQLKGRAAGVTITSNGATPGSQGQIRIRGTAR